MNGKRLQVNALRRIRIKAEIREFEAKRYNCWQIMNFHDRLVAKANPRQAALLKREHSSAAFDYAQLDAHIADLYAALPPRTT